MLDHRFQPLVSAFLMSVFMSGLMSLAITYHHLGFAPHFASLWLQAASFAFIVAFPAVLVVAPLVRKIVEMLVRAK